MTPIFRPSPNFGPRRHGLPPDMVVLHHTAMLTSEAACARLCDPKAEVSAHYLISEKGDLTQLVDEEMRAWHAGAGSWGMVRDVNSHSVGIELANSGPLGGFPLFPEAQMVVLEELLAGILRRWTIPPERVIAHSDMAPSRKFDPGPKFDWQRLAQKGLSVWPDEISAIESEVPLFAEFARQFGYGSEEREETLLSAFRMRFRPDASGDLEPTDLAIIRDLATRFPVDPGIGAH